MVTTISISEARVKFSESPMRPTDAYLLAYTHGWNDLIHALRSKKNARVQDYKICPYCGAIAKKNAEICPNNNGYNCGLKFEQ